MGQIIEGIAATAAAVATNPPAVLMRVTHLIDSACQPSKVQFAARHGANLRLSNLCVEPTKSVGRLVYRRFFKHQLVAGPHLPHLPEISLNHYAWDLVPARRLMFSQQNVNSCQKNNIQIAFIKCVNKILIFKQ